MADSKSNPAAERAEVVMNPAFSYGGLKLTVRGRGAKEGPVELEKINPRQASKPAESKASGAGAGAEGRVACSGLMEQIIARFTCGRNYSLL